MGEILSFPKIEMPLDLDEGDITAIVEWMRRSEGWGAKFARISHRPGLHDKRWAYVFRCGPTSDACSIITITRTSLEYSVVTKEVSLGATPTAGRGADTSAAAFDPPQWCDSAPSDRGALHAIVATLEPLDPTGPSCAA
jgi:hypothetical protein